ncbi:MAG: hypothetical protein RIQ33_2065 [Bacteroidota bacterium]
MKNKLFLLLPLLLVSLFSKAQINLVQNYSFENYSSCPTQDSQLPKSLDWTISVNTPDFFDTCAYFSVGVPINAWGYQYPATGSAYAGFYAYIQTHQSSNEYLGQQLSSPLIIGQKYFVTFNVSLSDANSNLICGVDKIGVLFTNVFLGDTVILPPPFKNNFAHIYTNSIITDTSHWEKVSGSFIADSAYNYFMIGHFYDSIHTNIQCLDTSNHTNRWAYYFVDDICISTDSHTCNPIKTAVDEVNLSSFLIYPNPVQDIIHIKGTKDYSCLLMNLLGTPVRANDNDIIDVSDLPNGIYILTLISKNKILQQKIIIQH